MSAPLAELFPDLNPSQADAVAHQNGPALVLAGAGSGKTRVLIARMERLVRQGCAPWAILAVTFTNKAAAEMRERLRDRLGPDVRLVWVGTFHSVCLRILRIESEALGFRRDFVVYDPGEGRRVLTRVLRDMDLCSDDWSPRSVLGQISALKNDGFEADRVLGHERFAEGAMRTLGEIFVAYDAALRRANAMDFDDLLLRTRALFRDFPEVRQRYAERFSQVLVDEYQDTNLVQFDILRLLCGEQGNLFVVGDDDQSIYRFRGATIENILNFESTYPGCAMYMLEQNYRSTQVILDCANALIANNAHRHSKHLFSDLGAGELVRLAVLPSAEEEVRFVQRNLEQLHAEGHLWQDMAVLYRTNAQSRLFEAQFRQRGIPYRVLGSFEFWQRREIQDALGYLQLLINPADQAAFERVVNTPTRGIGATSLEPIVRMAADTGVPILEAARMVQPGLRGRARNGLEHFLEMVEGWRAQLDDFLLVDLVADVIERSGIRAAIEKREPDRHQAQARLENLDELVNAAAAFAEERGESVRLDEFLEEVVLGALSDGSEQTDAVNLLTMHAAKGLEFPVVFLTGLENTLIPSPMAMGNIKAIEEERRLLYVAITRARERLILSRAQQRTTYGRRQYCGASQFLRELPASCLRRERSTPW